MIEEIKKILIDILDTDLSNVDVLLRNDDLSFLDSLQFLSFVVELEEKFDISIEPDELVNLSGLNSVKEIINSKRL